MRASPSIACLALITALGAPAIAQSGGGAATAAPADTAPDPIKIAVARLDLEKYKATIKGLTQFGDRRQGTKRNRDAVDWIEAQLKSYGCTNTERTPTRINRATARDAVAVPAVDAAPLVPDLDRRRAAGRRAVFAPARA
jgi:hypothetical protein